jgi:hypothetical protein
MKQPHREVVRTTTLSETNISSYGNIGATTEVEGLVGSKRENKPPC